MHTRTTAAITAALALALTACGSSGSDDKPNPPATSTPASATPTVDQAAARQACIDGWVAILKATDEPDVDDEPAVCDQVPGQSAEMYAEALRQNNAANRKPLDDCLADPTCTALPIP